MKKSFKFKVDATKGWINKGIHITLPNDDILLVTCLDDDYVATSFDLDIIPNCDMETVRAVVAHKLSVDVNSSCIYPIMSVLNLFIYSYNMGYMADKSVVDQQPDDPDNHPLCDKMIY